MIDELDLYTHPDATADIKNALKVLNEQIKIVEGLEHAKARLESTSSLDSNTLSKCNVFVRHVNNCTAGSSFDSEVRKLNLAELAFCSISFEERRLKSVAGHFAASNIQAYITTSRVSCLDRPEVFARLKRLSVESTGQRFHEIYTAKQAAHDCSWQSAGTSSNELLNDTSPSPKPATTAKQLGAFEFPTARWRNIDNVFPKQTADAIHRAPQRFVDSDITDCVRSSFPRDQSDGDAIIWMDLDHLAMLSLLRDTRRGIRTSMVRDIFGDAIANAMEESDLRKWEKRNGSIETTACVGAKVFCHIELRIGCDSAIAKKLFN